MKSSSPNKNYGSVARLRVRKASKPGGAFSWSYLTFTVSGLNGAPVTSASLRLKATRASPDSGAVYLVDPDAWTESTITWNTKPPLGTQIAAAQAVRKGTVDIPIASAATRFPTDGTYSLALANSTSAKPAIYCSREPKRKAGCTPLKAPQLIIVTGVP